jgi:predicted enzyme related to lactoylglutathione lyase
MLCTPAALSRRVQRKGKTMFKKIAFTMFGVEDSERARAFYETKLGFTRGSSSKDGVWTEYDLPGGGCLALFKHPDPKQQPPRGSAGASVAFEVDDLDALIPQLKGKGVTFKSEIIPSPVCRMSIIEDSEGNSIVLHQLHAK